MKEVTPEQIAKTASQLAPLKGGEEVVCALTDSLQRFISVTDLREEALKAKARDHDARIDEFSGEEEKRISKEIFEELDLIKSLRGLMWSAIRMEHPEIDGTKDMGVRKNWTVVNLKLRSPRVFVAGPFGTFEL
jgi:hypothetical protein